MSLKNRKIKLLLNSSILTLPLATLIVSCSSSEKGDLQWNKIDNFNQNVALKSENILAINDVIQPLIERNDWPNSMTLTPNKLLELLKLENPPLELKTFFDEDFNKKNHVFFYHNSYPVGFDNHYIDSILVTQNKVVINAINTPEIWVQTNWKNASFPTALKNTYAVIYFPKNEENKNLNLDNAIEVNDINEWDSYVQYRRDFPLNVYFKKQY